VPMSVRPPNDNQLDDQLRELWQAQQLEGKKMSLEEIRDNVRTFEKKIRGRNMLEYIAAGIVLLSFGIQMFQPTPPNFMTRIGAGLTVLATIYVVYTLRTRGSVKNIPDTMGRASFIEFYRSSLESQRDLLHNVWRWYLLPFAPGMVAMLVSFAIRDGLILNPTPFPEQLRNGLFLLLFSGVLVLFFFLVAAVNRRAARKLQSEIDALEHQ
jgi:hypothetical protein